MRTAAALRDSTSVISRPDRDSASKWLGVTNVASGRICAFSAWSVSSAWPGSWPLQISTGSRTTLAKLFSCSAPATVLIVAGLPSMPIFTVSKADGAPDPGPYAAVVASSWSAITCWSTGTKRWFQLSFGSKETMQVRLAMPKTPSSWKVFRSAWAPAPPVASEPAMVRTTAGPVADSVASGETEVMHPSCHPASNGFHVVKYSGRRGEVFTATRPGRACGDKRRVAATRRRTFWLLIAWLPCFRTPKWCRIAGKNRRPGRVPAVSRSDSMATAGARQGYGL
ncbi:hypothetical protein QFZ60_003504 [Arthrobacter sp. B2I5]|nr:hypothetical protein [Arthrobacter sp. B2I5]